MTSDSLIIITSESQAMLPLGETWETNPPCWKNYVEGSAHHKGLQRSNHSKTMTAIRKDLAKWNITTSTEPHCLRGKSEDLLAWFFTYG